MLKKLMLIGALVLSLTATCSATSLKYVCDFGDYDSHVYVDVDSIRLAEKNDESHRGFVFRTFWKPSGVDRMKFLATNMGNGSAIAFQLYEQNYAYSVYIYELDLMYRMRTIAVEFRNQNDDIIKVLNFKDPPYKDTHEHSQDYRIAKTAYTYAREKFQYIKTLPYYDHASQSYKK
jgi:hypothetical protein